MDDSCLLPLSHHPPPLVSDPEPDPHLIAEGWERRFTADALRAREAIELYTSLGYEVRLEAIQPSQLSPACGDCRVATCFAYQTIYTRKKHTSPHKEAIW